MYISEKQNSPRVGLEVLPSFLQAQRKQVSPVHRANRVVELIEGTHHRLPPHFAQALTVERQHVSLETGESGHGRSLFLAGLPAGWPCTINGARSVQNADIKIRCFAPPSISDWPIYSEAREVISPPEVRYTFNLLFSPAQSSTLASNSAVDDARILCKCRNLDTSHSSIISTDFSCLISLDMHFMHPNANDNQSSVSSASWPKMTASTMATPSSHAASPTSPKRPPRMSSRVTFLASTE